MPDTKPRNRTNPNMRRAARVLRSHGFYADEVAELLNVSRRTVFRLTEPPAPPTAPATR